MRLPPLNVLGPARIHAHVQTVHFSSHLLLERVRVLERVLYFSKQTFWVVRLLGWHGLAELTAQGSEGRATRGYVLMFLTIMSTIK